MNRTTVPDTFGHVRLTLPDSTGRTGQPLKGCLSGCPVSGCRSVGEREECAARARGARNGAGRGWTAGLQPSALFPASFALGANKAHGRQMTAADKKHAILLALKTWPERSQTQIGEQIGCTQAFVSRIREQVNTSIDLPDRVTGKDGKSYPAVRRSPGTTQERM